MNSQLFCPILNTRLKVSNSGDLNSKLVWYLIDSKQFVHRMVSYSSHVLKAGYLNGEKFGNQMAFVYQTFYHGH